MKALLIAINLILLPGVIICQRIITDSIDHFDGNRKIMMNELPFTGTLNPYLSMASYSNKTDTTYILSVFVAAKGKTAVTNRDSLTIDTKSKQIKLGYSGIESQLNEKELFSFDVELTKDVINILSVNKIETLQVKTYNETHDFIVAEPAQKYIIRMLKNLVHQSRSVASRPFLNSGYL